MKKLKSLLYVITPVILVGLSSCGSDGPGSINKGDTQAAFESVGNNLASSFGELSEAPGAVGLNAFADLTSTVSPFATKIGREPREVREHIKVALSSLRSMIANSSSENGKFPGGDGFVFDDHKGLYVYNSELGYFQKQEDVLSIIKIQYPTAGPESSDNDAEFQLAGYTETLVNGEYQPTFIDATLLIDGVTQATVDLTAEYNMVTYEPKFVDLSVFVTPFRFDLDLDDKKSTSTSASESLSKNNSLLIGFGVNVSYASQDKSEENISAISGYIQIMRIKFVASIVRANVQSFDDIKIAVRVDGKDAGDIVLVEDEFGDVEPNIKYNDGSLQSLEEIFGDLAAELEGLFGGEEPA